MKKLISLFALAAAFTSAQSWGSILTLDQGPTSIENINIAQTGTVNVNGQSIKLTEAGAGIRYEPVAFINVEVYIGQLLLSDVSQFDRSDDSANSVKALDSLDKVSVIAIQMNFVHDASVGQQLSAYNRGFDDNLYPVAGRIDPTTKQIVAPKTNPIADALKAFEDAVKNGGAIKSGQKQVLVFQKLANGQESVTYETAANPGVTVTGPAGFSKALLSAWIGKQTNTGVAAVKKDFIDGRTK